MKKIFKLFTTLAILMILCYIAINFNFESTATNNEINNNTSNTEVKDTTPNTEVKDTTPNTEDIIKYLCSETIADRAIGTAGNTDVTKYLETLFKELELSTVFSDSFLNNFYHESENIKLSNVVGKLNGLNSKKAIIITSHFDAWCNGALDNASGVAANFKIINKLKKDTSRIPLKYDVIFVMTNAEMSQFIGSQNFVEDILPMYSSIYNINIDCVGAKDGGPLALKNISRIENSALLYDPLKKVLKEHNIEYSDTFSSDKVEYCYNNNFGVSDYFSFERKGIPNIHIAQQGISNLILNDNDDPENLDFNKIDALGDALAKFIQQVNLD